MLSSQNGRIIASTPTHRRISFSLRRSPNARIYIWIYESSTCCVQRVICERVTLSFRMNKGSWQWRRRRRRRRKSERSYGRRDPLDDNYERDTHTHTHTRRHSNNGSSTLFFSLSLSLSLSLCRTLNKKDLFLFAFVLLNCIDPYWEQVSLQLLQWDVVSIIKLAN